MTEFDPATTALVLVDLQNDFLHPDGAYGRAGQKSDAIGALPGRLAPLAAAIRAAGGWIVSTHFTLVPGKGGEPFILDHLRKLRPFLAKGDELGVFHLGSTVVLLTEPGFELAEGLGHDSRVEYGQALLRRREVS